jgi:hypothetical protein
MPETMTDIIASSALLASARRRVALALIPIAALWLGVLWAALGGRAPERGAAVPAAPAVLETVVLGGQASPAGGSFDRFDLGGEAIPAPANSQGAVSFFATLLRGQGEEGLFLAGKDGVAKIAAVGDKVPSGESIAGFGQHPAPVLNEAGSTAFAVALTGGTAQSGVFRVEKGRMIALALSGAAAPDLPGATLAEFEPPALNDKGHVAFIAELRRGRELEEAIYVHRGDRLKKLVAAGDPAPGGGAFSSFGNPAINNRGDVAFAAIVEQGPNLGGVFLSSDDELRLVLPIGAPSPTGGIFARFSERLALNDAGTIALSAVLRQGGPSAAIFTIDNDTPRAVMAIGDAVPGGGTIAALASWPVLGQSGAVAFIASVDGGPNGLGVYLAGAGAPKRVIASGDPLPDGSRLAGFPLYPAIAIGGKDTVTFAATAERDGIRNDALFSYGPPRH